MESLVFALGPAFAAGFAVQRLLELLDPLYPAKKSRKEFGVPPEQAPGTDPADPAVAQAQADKLAAEKRYQDYEDHYRQVKTRLLGLISLVAGMLIVMFTSIRVVRYLVLAGTPMILPDPVDAVATALIISAGTEGLNSIVKFMGYAKDNQKEPPSAAKS